MDMTGECISFTSDPRDMLLSLHIDFRFVRSAVACAILERTSASEPQYETKVLEASNSSGLLSFNLDLPLNAMDAVRT